VEQGYGRWRRALTLYDRVLALDPQNQDARILRSSVLADDGSRIRIDGETKAIAGDRIERVGRLSAHVLLPGYLRIGAAVEHNHMTFGEKRVERQRGEIYLQQNFENGSEWRASAFGTHAWPGGGFGYGRTDSTGKLHIQADYRRPFWEFLESVLDNGTRDRAEIHREQRLGRGFSARGTVAYNRYGLSKRDNVARSIGYDGGIASAMFRSNPYLAFEYSFDIESRSYLRENAIPLTSREVHAGSLTGQVRVSRTLIGETFAGYSTDRLGGEGTFLGVRLTHGGPSRVGFQLWYDRRMNFVASRQVVDRAGAYLYWRFQ
jgi:hypothetical protein